MNAERKMQNAFCFLHFIRPYDRINFLSNLQSLLGRTKALPYRLIYIYQDLWDDGLIEF